MGLARDPERSRRYQKIEELLPANAQRQPEITNIDQIVPLPPAPLPPWDGGLQWQKAFSGPGPDQPSEELISQLAKAKQLDPATGLSEPVPRPRRPRHGAHETTAVLDFTGMAAKTHASWQRTLA